MAIQAVQEPALVPHDPNAVAHNARLDPNSFALRAQAIAGQIAQLISDMQQAAPTAQIAALQQTYNNNLAPNTNIFNRFRLLFSVGPQEIDRQLSNYMNTLNDLEKIHKVINETSSSTALNLNGKSEQLANIANGGANSAISILNLKMSLKKSRLLYFIPICAAKAWNWSKNHPKAATSIAIGAVAAIANGALSTIGALTNPDIGGSFLKGIHSLGIQTSPSTDEFLSPLITTVFTCAAIASIGIRYVMPSPITMRAVGIVHRVPQAVVVG